MYDAIRQMVLTEGAKASPSASRELAEMLDVSRDRIADMTS
jgi:hypothetical protein